MNRYVVFLQVIEAGSFTQAAETLGYTQSAISQQIQSLEAELGTTLLARSRKGVALTADGKQLLPYISRVVQAYRELIAKKEAMHGLEKANIRIGTFTSVSSNWLPSLMQDFKQLYPNVHFALKQGEYTNIEQYIKEGSVDFGFVNPAAVNDLMTIPLKQDQMLAIVPETHPLAKEKRVTLAQLAQERYILLDQGDFSEPLQSFQQHGLMPQIEYRVIDDYTIMSMVENGLGVSILSELVLRKVNYRFVTKETVPPIYRTIGIAFQNKQTLPIASRKFVDYIVAQFTRDEMDT